jgi:hypothetical protein
MEEGGPILCEGTAPDLMTEVFQDAEGKDHQQEATDDPKRGPDHS